MFLLYLMLAPKQEPSKTMDLESTKETVTKEIEEMERYVENTTEWAGEDIGEIGYLTPKKDDAPKTEPMEDVLKYFITGIVDHDIDIFLSSFHPETISKDLFKKDSSDKRQVASDMIKEISRNGTLSSVQYSGKKGLFNSPTNEMEVYFIYEDKLTVKVDITVTPVGDSHHEEDELYVITTSVWDIIHQIKDS
jgi:hypothetical protein